MSAKGNTKGRVVGETGTAPVGAAGANPAAKAETAAEAAAQTSAPGSLGTRVLDGTQTALDVVGLIPGVGEIADLANAGISAARGDYVGAALSLASAIPFAGWGATAAKVGRKAVKETAEQAAERAAKEAAQKQPAQKAAKEKAAKEGEAADAAAAKKPAEDGAKVKGKPKTDKGKCGEWLARQDLMSEGFDEVMEVQNNSGHGVDLIGRNSKTGEVKVWEVKTTDGTSAPSLSKAQKTMGGKRFTEDRVSKAATGYKNYGKTPGAKAKGIKAREWLDNASTTTYEKREVFVDDLDKGCAKHPGRPSKSSTWIKKP